MPQLGMTLEEIRAFAGEGEIVGPPSTYCESVAPLETAGEGQLSFVKDARFFDAARASCAGALLVPAPIPELDTPQLVVKAPYEVFGRLLARIARQMRGRRPAGVHPRAVVDSAAALGAEVSVGAGAVVEEAAVIGDRCVLYPGVYLGRRSVLGADCVLHPNVVIMEDVTIGDRVVIHGGTVIGADGYGYLQIEGRHLKIPQIGRITIGDDVEIGALVTIDRATLDTTAIGRGTKIGDFTHVGHNCQVGEDVLLLPTVILAGSVKVGDRVIFAGHAASSDNLTIGEDASLGATAVAFKDVPPGASMWGSPAREKGLEMRIQSALRRLPGMLRDLRALKKRLDPQGRKS